MWLFIYLYKLVYLTSVNKMRAGEIKNSNKNNSNKICKIDGK